MPSEGLSENMPLLVYQASLVKGALITQRRVCGSCR